MGTVESVALPTPLKCCSLERGVITRTIVRGKGRDGGGGGVEIRMISAKPIPGVQGRDAKRRIFCGVGREEVDKERFGTPPST